MMLVEETSVPTAALPIDAFKDHLRLGTGFSNANVQDALLESFLRAAMAAIEARTGKVLLTREFSWTLPNWRDAACQTLPVAPVQNVTELAIVDRNNLRNISAVETYWLEQDHSQPRLVAAGFLPSIPTGGVAEVLFRAGFADTFEDLPSDLAQAVLMLAAHFYENRDAMGMGSDVVPFGVSVLLERYRTMRLVAGARS